MNMRIDLTMYVDTFTGLYHLINNNENKKLEGIGKSIREAEINLLEILGIARNDKKILYALTPTGLPAKNEYIFSISDIVF